MAEKFLIRDTNIQGLRVPTIKKREVELPNTLPGTVVNPYRTAFILFRNGFGDFIIFSRAFEYLADHWPQVYGTIFCPMMLVQYYKFLFDKYKNWSIEASECAGVYDEHWSDPRFAQVIDPQRNGKVQFATAQGFHPTELGFAFYCNMSHLQIPASHNNYSLLDFTDEGLPKELVGKNYAVISAGAIRNTGRVPGNYWNPIIDYLKKIGIVPVLLGARVPTKGYLTSYPDGINAEQCVNLWDKTTIMQAAQIMQYAKFTVGVDSGLLHLAACTPATVIFGYNVTSVELRKPRRQNGRTIDVFLTKEELACSGCLTNVKLLYMHDFNESCLYDHIPERNMACVHKLFEGGGKRWIRAIDEALA